MVYLKVIHIVLIAVLLVSGIETIIKIRRSKDMPLEQIRRPLVIRINIIMCLTIAVAVVTVINILINNK